MATFALFGGRQTSAAGTVKIAGLGDVKSTDQGRKLLKDLDALKSEPAGPVLKLQAPRGRSPGRLHAPVRLAFCLYAEADHAITSCLLSAPLGYMMLDHELNMCDAYHPHHLYIYIDFLGRLIYFDFLGRLAPGSLWRSPWGFVYSAVISASGPEVFRLI